MPAVVSDSSPLVYLSRLGRFDLLRSIYDQVFIPSGVWKEVAIEGAGRPETAALQQAVHKGWITVEQIGGLPVPEEAKGLD